MKIKIKLSVSIALLLTLRVGASENLLLNKDVTMVDNSDISFDVSSGRYRKDRLNLADNVAASPKSKVLANMVDGISTCEFYYAGLDGVDPALILKHYNTALFRQ
jgi:hypothetical protein